MKRCSGELSHVLAAKRNFNFDSLLNIPARLIREPQQGPSNPALYFLACKFNHTIVRVLKAASHGAKGIRCEGGVLTGKGWPLCRWPGKNSGVHHCHRSCRVLVQPDCGCHTEYLAGGHIADRNLVAVLSRFGCADIAVEQHEERLRPRPLGKDLRILTNAVGPSRRQQALDVSAIPSRQTRGSLQSMRAQVVALSPSEAGVDNDFVARLLKPARAAALHPRSQAYIHCILDETRNASEAPNWSEFGLPLWQVPVTQAEADGEGAQDSGVAFAEARGIYHRFRELVAEAPVNGVIARCRVEADLTQASSYAC